MMDGYGNILPRFDGREEGGLSVKVIEEAKCKPLDDGKILRLREN